MPYTLLTLLSLYPPPMPPRAGASGGPELLVVVVLIVVAFAVMVLRDELRRLRVVKRIAALPRTPSPGARCVLTAKVTRGETEIDPLWQRPAVWFEITLRTSERPPGEIIPGPITLAHRGRCELTSGDAIIAVETHLVCVTHTRDALSRSVTSDELPAPLLAQLENRLVPARWKSGAPIRWSVYANAIRVGDELTAIGTTRPLPERVATVDVDSASGYRDGPRPDPRQVWTLTEGPGRDDRPLLTGATGATPLQIVTQSSHAFVSESWLRGG